ncbi:MAG: DUF6263 family protein [Candidatus Kapaibacteriota bacterium]|jgi:hypothetical protein
MVASQRFCLVLAAVCMAAVPTVAQTSGAPSKQYRAQVIYTAGVAQSYEITEQTTATRWYSDSSQKNYDRTVTYFTTIRCIESMDGIARVVVNVDSMRYRFMADGRLVEYDSEKDVSPKNFSDINAYIGPLNRPFTLTVSPYGEVSALEGEQVEYWRDYLADNSSGIDSVTYLMWTQAISDENLLHYGDLQKRVVPGLTTGKDSTWNLTMTLRVDGVTYKGRTKATLTDVDGGLLTMTVSDTLQAVAPQPLRVYGVPYVVQLMEGHADVSHTLQMSRTGSIQQVDNVASTWWKGRVLMEEFTQRVRTTTTWKLKGQYQW